MGVIFAVVMEDLRSLRTFGTMFNSRGSLEVRRNSNQKEGELPL